MPNTLQHLTGSGGHVLVPEMPVTADFPAVTLPDGVTFPLVQPVTEWSATVSNDVQETTDTGTGGWAAHIAGVSSWEGSATFYWDTVVTTMTAAVVFAPGRPLGLKLQLGKYKITLPTSVTTPPTPPTFSTTGGYALTGYALVTSFAVKTPVKGPVEITVSFKGTGPCVLA